ncbi:hypothetical protein Mmc1_1515 [Magnetococcus marinus MC-1]|uniref:Uncharacterized protein n=1 Tax=Magnetococcus marinus (strain ATCC BAA-1437 / JCM 17883 / MC-1) TaxID=156889 RepID=A0L7T1_MAGMM|nr:hypothetical protein Mmc1_1515 [Magnetococcus marinus MC-1]
MKEKRGLPTGRAPFLIAVEVGFKPYVRQRCGIWLKKHHRGYCLLVITQILAYKQRQGYGEKVLTSTLIKVFNGAINYSGLLLGGALRG